QVKRLNNGLPLETAGILTVGEVLHPNRGTILPCLQQQVKTLEPRCPVGRSRKAPVLQTVNPAPIALVRSHVGILKNVAAPVQGSRSSRQVVIGHVIRRDRKSTRLNSSNVKNSYDV